MYFVGAKQMVKLLHVSLEAEPTSTVLGEMTGKEVQDVVLLASFL